MTNLGKISTQLNTTSAGQYPKCKINDMHYKLGNYTPLKFINRENIVEVIGSKISQELNINTIKYSLCDVTAEINNRTYKTIAVQSKHLKDFTTFGKIIDIRLDVLEQLHKIFTKEDISKMIAIDSIMEQKDRHINNIGLNTDKQLILFDYGRALLHDTEDFLLYKWQEYDFVGRTYYKDFGIRVDDIIEKILYIDLTKLDITSIVRQTKEEYAKCEYKQGYIIEDRYFYEIENMLKRGVELYEQKWH